MNSQDFHIAKEKQQRQINTLIQTVNGNRFSQETKNNFTNTGSELINSINKQRKIAYKELEEFDFQDQYNHEQDYNVNVSIDTVGYDTKALQHKISEKLSSLKAEKVNASLTGPTNNKLSEESTLEIDELKKHTEALFDHLIEIIINAHQTSPLITEEPKEDAGPKVNETYLDIEKLKTEALKTPVEETDHILTQEDFDNNPDLYNQGLNIGDAIKVSFADDDNTPKDQTPENPTEQYWPKGGSTVITPEEIKKQDEQVK